MSALLQVRNVSKRFGGLVAVNDVSFDIQRGNIHALIGPNGAGKTTMFNMISALVQPSDGELLFEEHPLHKTRPDRLAGLGIGRTFQNLAVFGHATVVQNLLVGMHHRTRTGLLEAGIFFGRARQEEIRAREKVEEIIEFLEIEDLRDTPVGALSYGLQKRVELGRALAVGPKLMLLDEMVSGMNGEETEDIGRFILDINETLDITILMIEHDMHFVMDISDRVTVLNYGQLIADGTPAEVSASEAVIKAYLGRA